jgi:hypothetical protein
VRKRKNEIKGKGKAEKANQMKDSIKEARRRLYILISAIRFSEIASHLVFRSVYTVRRQCVNKHTAQLIHLQNLNTDTPKDWSLRASYLSFYTSP